MVAYVAGCQLGTKALNLLLVGLSSSCREGSWYWRRGFDRRGLRCDECAQLRHVCRDFRHLRRLRGSLQLCLVTPAVLNSVGLRVADEAGDVQLGICLGVDVGASGSVGVGGRRSCTSLDDVGEATVVAFLQLPRSRK